MTHKSLPLFEWAIIGAGPAGIAALGQLLDAGVAKETILWIDPHFHVGDLGAYWFNVPSNTRIQYFLDFLSACVSFNYKQAPSFRINQLSPEQTCLLQHIVDPLQWVTDHLKQNVSTEEDIVIRLSHQQRQWLIRGKKNHYFSKKVILAIGAVPEKINHSSLDIPLSTALNREQWEKHFDPHLTYGVIGSSHSAILVLQHLIELNAKKIINIYRSPCRYAIPQKQWILFDNTGLKGQAALFAREYIDGHCPASLERYCIDSSEEALNASLSSCDAIIAATGFSRRKDIDIQPYHSLRHDPHHGILAPGLFGCGIAYPEQVIDPFGHIEYAVGLWKFMDYLKRIIPLWLNYE